MKAIKAGVVVLAVGMLLTGCGSHWDGEVRFKVTRIDPPYESMGKPRPARAVLELDQAQPDSVQKFATAGADIDQFPEGIKAGDPVVCQVVQNDDNGFDDVDMKTTIGPCRKA